MAELADRAREAARIANETILAVCGACGNSCCHQGTMMGSHDSLRLLKGFVLEPGREEKVREGLRRRARELSADLETLRAVRNLVAASSLRPDDATLDRLDGLLEQWDAIRAQLEGPWEASEAGLQSMLRYAGVRALVLRCLGEITGGHAALSTLAREGSSFRFRGRRMAPPRCLFHDPDTGCLAGRWKPGKCANFYCSGEPNVIAELRAALSFDAFVLANAQVHSPADALALLQRELDMGHAFVEPKIILAAPPEFAARALQVLGTHYPQVVQVEAGPGEFMVSSAEFEARLEGLAEGQALLITTEALSGAGLYELAICLDRLRGEGRAVPLVLLATRFAESGPLAHPLWADAEMSQPLACLDLWVLEPES